jgi:hypothetical protein
MKCSILNPIRFYDSAGVPNYSSSFPAIDNITQRTEWIPGIHPTNWYKEWRTGVAMYLQFEIEGTESTNLEIYKYDESTGSFAELGTGSPLSGVDISPGGWATAHIYQYTFTPSSDGTYYLKFEGDTVTSDKFIVTSDSILIKQLVKIKYLNSENDFNCIFSGGEYFNQFLTGFISLGEPQNEISAFQSDRGNLELLQATPVRVANLIINDLHYTYVDHINLIFSCDTITVNGVTYQNSEPPTIEKIGDSDLVNVTVKLLQTNNEYLY